MGVEETRVEQAPFCKQRPQRGPDNAPAVDDAVAQIDGGGFGEVARRAGDFADVGTQQERLGDDLVIKNKIVGIVLEGQSKKQLAGVGAEAGVVLGEFGAEQEVLKESQDAVGEVLVARHAAAARL